MSADVFEQWEQIHSRYEREALIRVDQFRVGDYIGLRIGRRGETPAGYITKSEPAESDEWRLEWEWLNADEAKFEAGFVGAASMRDTRWRLRVYIIEEEPDYATS